MDENLLFFLIEQSIFLIIFIPYGKLLLNISMKSLKCNKYNKCKCYKCKIKSKFNIVWAICGKYKYLK